MNTISLLKENILNSKINWNDEIFKAIKIALLDYFASSLLARQHPALTPIKSVINADKGNPRFWLIGLDELATSKQAALYNGMQAHLLDIDDTHETVRGHPSAVILSALISHIPLYNHDNDDLETLSVERFLTAYIVGVEVMARLGEALGSYHYIKGWHNTSTIGVIAATAAICHLYQYPFVNSALSLAATQAAGLRLNFGTFAKPLHVGLAAQNAVQSIELCKAGFIAADDFLDDELGYLSVYGNSESQLALEHWGNPWQMFSPGLWFKDYEYCSANSYVIDALEILLEREVSIDPKEIASITITFSNGGDAALIHSSPKFQNQGKFSPEYLISERLLGHDLCGLKFENVPVSTSVSALMTKINRIVLSKEDSPQRFVMLEIKKKNGLVYTETVYNPKGSPKNPYSIDIIRNKLDSALPKNKSEFLYKQIDNLSLEDAIQNVLLEIKNMICN